MLKLVTHDELQDKLAYFYTTLEGLDQDSQSCLLAIEQLRDDYNTLVRLYNTELKQYKACVSTYRKLTEILLEIPVFREKWEQIHEAPHYDRR